VAALHEEVGAGARCTRFTALPLAPPTLPTDLGLVLSHGKLHHHRHSRRRPPWPLARAPPQEKVFLPCLSALSHLSAFLSRISSHMTHRQYYSDFILPRQPNRNQHSTPQKLAPPHSSCEKTHGKQCLSWRCLSWHTRLCVYIQQTLCCDCYEKTHGKQSLPWRYLSWRCLPWHTRQRRRLFRVFAHTAYAWFPAVSDRREYGRISYI
jgi:hypothetical protein